MREMIESNCRCKYPLNETLWELSLTFNLIFVTWLACLWVLRKDVAQKREIDTEASDYLMSELKVSTRDLSNVESTSIVYENPWNHSRSCLQNSIKFVGACISMGSTALKEATDTSERARIAFGSLLHGSESMDSYSSEQISLKKLLHMVQREFQREKTASDARCTRLKALCSQLVPIYMAAQKKLVQLDLEVYNARKAAKRAERQLDAAVQLVFQSKKGREIKNGHEKTRSAGCTFAQALLAIRDSERRNAGVAVRGEFDLRRAAISALKPLVAAEMAESMGRLEGYKALLEGLEGCSGANCGDFGGDGGVDDEGGELQSQLAIPLLHNMVEKGLTDDSLGTSLGSGHRSPYARRKRTESNSNVHSEMELLIERICLRCYDSTAIHTQEINEMGKQLQELLKLDDGREAFVDALNLQRSVGRTDLGPISSCEAMNLAYAVLCKGMRTFFDTCICATEVGVRRAKNAIMLSQSFYRTITPESAISEIAVRKQAMERRNSSLTDDMLRREFLKEAVVGHAIFKNSIFWKKLLEMCIEEQLLRAQTQPWYTLGREERAEMIFQVNSTVFSMCASITHSMLEMGCSSEQTTLFVTRTSYDHDLPPDKRTILMNLVTDRVNAELQTL